GAYVLVEDPRTAVMPGMPHSALEAGAGDRALALEKLHEALIDAVEKRRAEAEGERDRPTEGSVWAFDQRRAWLGGFERGVKPQSWVRQREFEGEFAPGCERS